MSASEDGSQRLAAVMDNIGRQFAAALDDAARSAAPHARAGIIAALREARSATLAAAARNIIDENRGLRAEAVRLERMRRFGPSRRTRRPGLG
jgi:hypothetical protein